MIMIIIISNWSFSRTDSVSEPSYLDNGLSYSIRQIPDTGLVSLYIVVRAGLALEGEYAGSGISHLSEHMVFKGADSMDEGELLQKIRSYGAYVNATTGLTSTSFYITVLPEYISEIIEIMSSAVMDPKLDEKMFLKEKKIILNELRRYNDDPSHKAFTLLFSTAFIRSSLQYPLIGYEDIFQRITIEDLKEYHSKFYVPNNIVVSIAGEYRCSAN